MFSLHMTVIMTERCIMLLLHLRHRQTYVTSEETKATFFFAGKQKQH